MKIADGANSIDFYIINEEEFSMLYFIDLDGSMKPSTAIEPTGPSTVIGSDDGRLLTFVDTSKCSYVESGYYSYCIDTCFRSMRYEVDIPNNANYTLKVCLKDDTTKCTTFDKGRKGDVGNYTFTAHLPVGKVYDGAFFNEKGIQTNPAFTQFEEESLCPTGSVYKVDIVRDMIGTAVKPPTASSPISSPPMASSPIATPPTAKPPTIFLPTASPPTIKTPIATLPVVTSPTATTPKVAPNVVTPPTAKPPTVSLPIATPPIVTRPTVMNPTATPPIATPLIADATIFQILFGKFKFFSRFFSLFK
jgi:hypothetical protein